jgi:UDP-N-acetylglucosamine 2-epimerase (non-hydrolysing)
MKPIAVVAGTRPEIIKMAPIIRALKQEHLPYVFIHSGQHYDYNMAQQFIEELQLPTPDFSLKIHADTLAAQTREIRAQTGKALERVEPSVVLVEGDTNSVLAAALAANKRSIPVGHVEAGLRSFDLRMPEEHNRRLTDHVSQFLFAPTERAKTNLLKENVWGKIFLTGNTVIDAVAEHLPIAEAKSSILLEVPFESYVLVTAHRAENVDDPAVLESFVEVFSNSPLPVVYPMHPRTKKRLQEKGMLQKLQKQKNLLLLPPQGYLDFLVLMKHCRLIITDSGGIQEEATSPAIRKPVLVIRLSTERQEAVEAGFAKVVGTKSSDVLAALNDALEEEVELPFVSPFGDGTAAKKTVEVLRESLV